MNVYDPGQRRRGKARDRQTARQGRRTSMATAGTAWREKLPNVALPGVDETRKRQAKVLLRDAAWYATHLPQVRIGLAAALGVVFLLFVGSHLLTGRIFPKVYAAGIEIGGMTVDEAALALATAWENSVRIQLVEGDRVWEAQPAEIGLRLDAQKTVEAARTVGMASIPMGWGVQPVISLDFNIAQDYLLDLSTSTDIAPFNAGYEWRSDQLFGVEGKNGRILDVPETMDRLIADPVKAAEARRIDLLMTTIPPEVDDPAPFLEDAQAIAAQPFTLYGYDPFKDETLSWSTSREVFTSWLEAGDFGLTLRDDTYSAFLEAQSRSLNPESSGARYLDPIETKEKLRQAIADQQSSVTLRIRYRPSTYEVVGGDTGYRIARKTGLPYYLIEEANVGRDLGKLSIGDQIQLPSPDSTLPNNPIPHKRIVVNLDNQSLMAYENGQVKFNWLVSSGMSDYPTYPGVYQILNHDEKALGSSFTLCNSSAGCGQWEMYWFMGIYEVTPGLMNGFHGAVLLPNGGYLGGGSVGSPYTFGCVMSQDDNARLLYDWAEEGTIVEIISSEYAPKSALGQLTLNPPPASA